MHTDLLKVLEYTAIVCTAKQETVNITDLYLVDFLRSLRLKEEIKVVDFTITSIENYYSWVKESKQGMLYIVEPYASLLLS